MGPARVPIVYFQAISVFAVYLSCLVMALHALWAYWFSGRISNQDRTNAERRVKALDRLRWASFLTTVLQLIVFFILSSAGHGGKTQLFGWSLGLFILSSLIHGQITYGVEKLARKVKASRWEILRLAVRGLAGGVAIYLTYYAVTYVTISISLRLSRWLPFGEGLKTFLSYAATPLGVGAGLAFVFFGAPIFIRLMLPCSPVKDSQTRKILERCFKKGKLPVPTLWTLDLDRYKNHNAMVCGSKWGRGWFRPALFFSKGLLEHLSPSEFEAVMLHEVSHLTLHHVRKRLWASVFAFLAVFLPYVAVSTVLILIVPRQYFMVVFMGCLLLNVLAQIFMVRKVVRGQELEADENAVRLGALPQAMANALKKLSRLNDQNSKKKDPGSWFNAGAAHPTTAERVENIFRKAALGLPKVSPGLSYGWMIPASGLSLGVFLLVGFLFIKPGLELTSAAVAGDVKKMESMIASGARLGAYDYFHTGTFALFSASNAGHLPLVKVLLKNRADIHQRHLSGGLTALMGAAGAGHLDVVRYLLQHGAKPDETDDRGNTALTFAAFSGKTEVAKTLLDAGARVNSRNHHGSTPLTIAAEKGDIALVSLLIRHGAALDAKDGDGDSALGMAKAKKHIQVARLLERAGAREPGRYREARSLAGK